MRTSPESCFQDYSEKLIWRSRVFNIVLYLVKTKNNEQVRVTFLQCFKKKKKTETGHSLAVQRLGLHAKDPDSIPSQGAKIPQAVWCG